MKGDLGQLFQRLRVVKVVFVDDDFAVEASVGSILRALVQGPAAAEALSRFFPGLNLDVQNEALPDLIRNALAQLDASESEEIDREIQNLTGDVSGDGHRLREMIPAEVEAVFHSPRDWAAQRNALVAECTEERRTLFLFDEELNADPELGFESGSEIIKSLSSDHPAAFGVLWFCGILSNKLHKGDELSTWQSLAREREIELKFFMPISKENLLDVLDFYSAIYRTVINTYCEGMKDLAASQLSDALEATKKRFADLDPIDFEHMVVKSSEDEGVSEIETLLRLYSIIQRDEVKVRILVEPVFVQFLDAALAVKQAVDVDRQLPSISRERIYRLRHAELYERAELVNGFHDPLRNGDLFEVGDDRVTFVLIVQPCDVMVRKDGKRARENTFKVAVLAPVEARAEGGSKDALTFSLPNFASEGGEPYLVHFSKATVANLNVLDLAVLSNDGTCQINPKQARAAASRFPTRSWDARIKEVAKYFQKVVTEVEQARKAHADEVAALLAAARLPRAALSTKFSLLGTYTGETFSYPIRRCGRIRDPLAASLLAAYGRYLGRDAFDHDFSSEGQAA